MKTGVIIPAAGQGKRMEAGMNKLFIPVDHKPILIHTLEVFMSHSEITEIVLVIHKNDIEKVDSLLEKYKISKVKLVEGGEERQHSVYKGLLLLEDVEVVLVHDAARPFIRLEEIERLLKLMEHETAALLAVPVKDTIKRVNRDGVIQNTPDRKSLWAAQTPQAFRLPILKRAYQKALEDGFIGSDDSSLVERLGYTVRVIEGSYENIKLTTPDDLLTGEGILERRKESGK